MWGPVCGACWVTSPEIEGRNGRVVLPAKQDRDAFKAAIQQTGEVSDFPGQMVRRDGSVIDISISSHALYDHAGNFAGVEGIYRDVTQRKNLERRLHRLATTDMLTGMANRGELFWMQPPRCTNRHALMARRLPCSCWTWTISKPSTTNWATWRGDRALAEFAHVVKTQLRATDVVGRLGGENSVCCYHRLTAHDQAVEIATLIMQWGCLHASTDETGRPTASQSSVGGHHQPL